MNHRERFIGTLTGKEVDRVPFIKVFGGTNAIQSAWEREQPGLSTSIDRVLQFEGVYRGWGTTPVNFGLSQRGRPVTLEDDECRRVQRFADGTVEILQKGRDYHHQTVEWPVKGPDDWRRVKAAYLQPDDPGRFPGDWPERVQEYRGRDYPLQLTHGGVYGFARNLMGDEQLLYAFYDAPGLVHDIMDGYTEMVLTIWSRMVREVEFDLIEFWEDMASKNGCLLSPDMFREFMLPNYRRVAAFAKEHKIEIILVDSDGRIDELAALMREGGVTAMYPFEVGAGCDVEEVRRRYPTLGVIGGLAKEAMIYGKAAIDREMEKARHLLTLGRLIPGPDHFVQSDVSWENYRYFMERLREVVLTTKPGPTSAGEREPNRPVPIRKTAASLLQGESGRDGGRRRISKEERATMKHSWLWWTKDDLRTERRQLVEEGRNTDGVNAEFDRLLDPDRPEDAAFQGAANALLDKTGLLSTRPDYPYVEPSDLDGIRAQRPSGPRTLALALDERARLSHISGAWLGRCAGCLLGKPIEGIRRPKLRALLERAGCGEITDYLWRLPGLREEDYRAVDLPALPGWRSIDHMPVDDDTNYTVAGMALIKGKGIGFTPADMADFWMANLPILHTCTAERVAYRNFVNDIEPPRSAVVRNPYREWIGAQIRADFFGYVALGRPEWAAELAWRDASISHVKNGIYGEMWVAAMLSAAPAETDVCQVIETGLGEIPAKCRLAEGIRDVLSWHAAETPYAEAVERIHRRWDEKKAYDWCHTVSNAQIVALGLLYGRGDFEKAITRAVFPCLDTDCNGATVGSILGMMLGIEALPSKWTGVMNDTVHTGLAGYHVSRISQLGEEMFALHRTAEKSLPRGLAARL